MQIFDSVQKKKVPFEPMREGEATLYVCGPTVYDDAHLGHARSALSFDLLSRTLRTLGYRVTYARNFTDIDDKIIKKINETGKSLHEITDYYIERYLEEMEALGVRRPEIEPKATETLDAIEAMISELLESGCAYRTKNGDIYFDTSKDPRYGTISHRVQEEEQTQSRLCELKSGHKRHPKDFALWKACADERDICFDLPLGSGRPGWHIECSAMIEKHFPHEESERYRIDIHGGGADLLFPHHENEAAQTRCATGHEIAKYWMHNGFVQIDGEKMSKSLGNSFFLKDALALYPGELLRFYLISVHYRNDFNFNEEDLLASKKRLDRLYRLKQRLLPGKAGEAQSAFGSALLEAMADDLNSSRALAVLDEMIAAANETLDAGKADKAFRRATLGNLTLVEELLGIGGGDPYAWFQHGIAPEEKERIETLIAERNDAKKAKDFASADAIREELHAQGIALMDTPEGTKWEKL